MSSGLKGAVSEAIVLGCLKAADETAWTQAVVREAALHIQLPTSVASAAELGYFSPCRAGSPLFAAATAVSFGQITSAASRWIFTSAPGMMSVENRAP